MYDSMILLFINICLSIYYKYYMIIEFMYNNMRVGGE